jgi:hypothetical protein
MSFDFILIQWVLYKLDLSVRLWSGTKYACGNGHFPMSSDFILIQWVLFKLDHGVRLWPDALYARGNGHTTVFWLSKSECCLSSIWVWGRDLIHNLHVAMVILPSSDFLSYSECCSSSIWVWDCDRIQSSQVLNKSRDPRPRHDTAAWWREN